MQIKCLILFSRLVIFRKVVDYWVYSFGLVGLYMVPERLNDQK